MDKVLTARNQLEQLIAGNPASLDELLRLRAQLGEPENPARFPTKKPATGPLSHTLYQPTTPRK